MAHLIDKDALVAEIERIKKEECPIDSYEGRCKLLWFERFHSFINSLLEEPVSEDLEEEALVYSASDTITGDGKLVIDSEKVNAFKAGAQWQEEQIKEALLSEILPCFMHGGEADEVVAKLDEVLNQKK